MNTAFRIFAGKNINAANGVISLSCRTPNHIYINFIKELVEGTGIEQYSIPDGVELSIRENDTDRYLFLINLKKEIKTVHFDTEQYSVLKEKRMGRHILLKGYDVEILKLQEDNGKCSKSNINQ